MKCAGNLGEGAVIFNKSGVGIREDSSIYKCTCSVMYLWFCSLCSFVIFFFFLYISFLKGHLNLPKMSYIWKNLYIKLKLCFLNWYWLETYVAFGRLCLYVLQGEYPAGCYKIWFGGLFLSVTFTLRPWFGPGHFLLWLLLCIVNSFFFHILGHLRSLE